MLGDDGGWGGMVLFWLAVVVLAAWAIRAFADWSARWP